MKRAAGVTLSGAALTLAAFVFDAAPLFVVGVALALLGAGNGLWVWIGTRAVTIERHLDIDRVVEEEPLEARVLVRRGRFPLPRAQVLEPLANSPLSLGRALSVISGSREIEVAVVARFSRRGLHHLAAPSLVVRDPLELASAAQVANGPGQSVLVLPRTEPVKWIGGRPGIAIQGSDAGSTHEPLAAADVDGLRPYRPGTPASRIHWPALARGAGLLERRLRADTDMRPLVILDPRSAADADVLDAAVRATGSLALELARRGGCRVLLPGERRPVVLEPELAAWPALHVRLALVSSGPGTRAPAIGPGLRLGPVFYVAAQPLERLPAALMTPGASASVLVLPLALRCALPAVASLEVAGCRGYLIGSRAARPRERAA